MRSRYQPQPTPGPKLRGLVDAITRDIQTGRLVYNERLPGTRTLAASLGWSRGTVVQAIQELVAEGWLVAEAGSGVRVRANLPQPPCTPSAPAQTAGFALYDRPAFTTDRRAASVPYQLLGGRADLRLLPLTELSRAYRRVLAGRGRRLVDYGDPRGEPRLRAALTDWLANTRGVRPSDDSILVTRGSQMALYLIAHSLLNRGDRVGVESLGYDPAWQAMQRAGATLVPIPLDDDGLQVTALPNDLRAVYLTPHHQYPTGITLSPERRARLLQWAQQHRTAIIEDDYDHEYHYDGAPISPLIASDPGGVVVSVGTLSKAFAPGIRIGFVVAPAPLIRQFIQHRITIDTQGDRVVEHAVAELIEDGTLERHLRRTRRVYAKRRTLLLELLAHYLPRVQPILRPGGMAIWCHAPGIDVTRWAAQSLKRGVRFETGSAYTYDKSTIPYVRLGFACHDEDELQQAVQRMAEAYNKVR